MDIARTDWVQRKRRKWLLFAGAALAMIVVAGAAISGLEPAAPAIPRSNTLIDAVKRGEFVREVRGPGTLVPKELRWIAAETAGRVERVVVKPGTTAMRDTVILELSNPAVDDKLITAETALVAARADLTARLTNLDSKLLDGKAKLRTADANYQIALAVLEAQAAVARDGIIPKVEFRRSQITADNLGAKLEIERERVAGFQKNIDAQVIAEHARLKQLEAAHSLARRQFDALHVRAGIDGVVQEVPVEEGQQVEAGTNLARVARPDHLRADIRIAETQASDVAIGQVAHVDTRSGIVKGRVSRIDPAVRNGTVRVEIEFEGTQPAGMRADLSVDATIEIDRTPDAMYVGRPASAVANSSARLFRLEEGGKFATRVPVRLGRASVASIEVLQGLQVGDAVVLSDSGIAGDVTRVRLK